MADEQTPSSFDDAADPIQDVPNPAQPLAAGQPGEPRDTADAARQVRSNRPVRRSRPTNTEQAPAQSAGVEDAMARDAQAGDIERASGAAENSQPAVPELAPRPRTPAPRPVRRVASAAAAEAAADQGTGASPAPVATTRRRPGQEVETTRRTTPAAFVRQSGAELRKVIWPTSTQLANYFVVVLLFVLFIVAYVGGLDFVFGWGLLKLLAK